MKTTTYYRHLRCPACRSGALAAEDAGDTLACEACSARFHSVNGKLILFDPSNAVFPPQAYLRATPTARRPQRDLSKWLPSPSINLAQDAVLSQMRVTLDTRGPGDVLVVGGGRQRLHLDSLLKAGARHCIVYTDVDAGADVDLFCDGHDLPFADACFDAVVTTAVLEHVLYPEQVASEIARVLKPGGLLYSELPFMQQVHEGAYDFTRYTLSGHRRLFNRFAEIDSGMVAGPGTALVWALENLALAFCNRALTRKFAKAFTRVFFSWIKHADRLLVDRPEAMDGASCTYFYGAKAAQPVTDIEIIDRYVGAKHVQHL